MVAPRRLEKLFSPLVIVGSASFIGGIAAMYLFVTLQHQSHSVYASVVMQALTETVSAQGTLKPAESISLAFRHSGVISRVTVGMGSRVANKQLLAALGSGNIPAELDQANAAVAAAQEKLTELQSATTSADLSGVRAALIDQITTSYTTADTSVRTEVGQFIRPNGSPNLFFQTSNPDLEQSLLAERIQMDQLLDAWKATLPVAGVAATTTPLATQATAAADHLSNVELFLNHIATLLAYAVPSVTASSADLENYRDTVVKARLSVAASLSALTVATGKFSITEVSTGPQAIEAQKSVLAAAQAKVVSLQSDMNDMHLYAPIPGTILQLYAGVGQWVVAGKPVFLLSSHAHAEMSAPISAADAEKIRVGDNAQVHFSSFSNKAFAAQIVAVSSPQDHPGQNTYTVTAQLTDVDPSLPIGTTGSISITTAESKNALIVPQSAIIIKDGQSYVLRASAGSHDDLVPVTTGIVADGGQVEIVSGLSEGEKIRTTISVY